MKKMISFFGGSMATEKEFNISYKIGHILAKRGWVVVNGAGDCGCMLGVSKGASEAGGTVVGIVPEDNVKRINKYIDIPIVTGIGFNRNFLVGNCTPAGICVGGSWGSLNEVTNNLQWKKPVVLVNNWNAEQLDYRDDRPTDLIHSVTAIDSWEDCEKVVDLFESVYKNRNNLGKVSYSDE